MSAPWDLITHRDAIKDAMPKWLNRGVAEKIIYSLGIHIDAAGDAFLEGIKARFPGHNPTADSELCKARQIFPGPSETPAQLEARLINWLDAHRLRGHPRGILEQLAAYFTPNTFPMKVIYNNGNFWQRNSDGTYDLGTASWNWDGRTDLPCRFWVILEPNTPWNSDGTFAGAGTVGDGGVLGSDATPTDVAGVRHIIKSWGNPHARHMNTIVVFSDSTTPVPDGTWGVMSHRNNTCSYWAGERP